MYHVKTLHAHPLKIIKKNWKLLVLSGFGFALLAVVLTLLLPLQYRAEAEALIIPQARLGVDPYTIARSSERIAENLVAVMQTSDFYDKVKRNSAGAVDWQYFESFDNERKKRTLWQQNVQPTALYGTGVMIIRVYHPNAAQATALAGAVANTLTLEITDYVGTDTAIKVVNDPIVTKYPVRPNIFLNGIAGLLIGIVVSGFVVVRRK